MKSSSITLIQRVIVGIVSWILTELMKQKMKEKQIQHTLRQRVVSSLKYYTKTKERCLIGVKSIAAVFIRISTVGIRQNNQKHSRL